MLNERLQDLDTNDLFSLEDFDSNNTHNEQHVPTTPIITKTKTLYQERSLLSKIAYHILTYLKFIGPGILISTSFLDAGNFSTAVTAASLHQYKFLHVIFLSTITASLFQVLAAKLGIVTGKDIPTLCKLHFSKNVNIFLYLVSEVVIIATDMAEVVGCAIGLSLLANVPLPVGVLLTIVDVLVILKYFNPANGEMRVVRTFEFVVAIFVMLTVACFVIELFQVEIPNKNDVWKGFFLPSKDLVQDEGLFVSLSILGSVCMAGTILLQSNIVHARLRNYDINLGNYTIKNKINNDNNKNYQPVDVAETEEQVEDMENDIDFADYEPSYEAVSHAYKYTVMELLISIFTVALFANAAIEIVAAASMTETDSSKVMNDADLYTIYDILSKNLSKTAGTVFALALLFSGLCGGFTTTLTGQIIADGFLDWSFPLNIRRSLSRAVAVMPCLILVFVSGKKGLSAALNASQVILSLLLPFVTFPLIYFTCNKKIMSVKRKINKNSITNSTLTNVNSQEDDDEYEYVDMSNGKIMTAFSIILWLLVSFLNIYLLFSFSVSSDTSL
ncbi:natural resistance-associated macrophage protein [Hanseniaspora valbyensis NRRL Y-1626]|uniref:Natural resistance-associated macrophage protein n=1 Tax=Hanseniaspora valbyensis NRRL Y-1626 TaxID=766949 RepID=A0A1B7TEA5_9ASCO|nr:natural resistance-associated macrophage protein [Hanseniaspora valbyensis NRRL Y-1626]